MKNNPPILPEITMLNCGSATHNADWNYQNIQSPFARIHTVTKGEAHILIGTERYKLSPGFIYLTPPFTLHTYECKGILELNYMHIYENPLSKHSIFDEYNMPVAIAANELDLSLVNRILGLNPYSKLTEYDPKYYDTEAVLQQNIERRSQTDMYTRLTTRSLLVYLMAQFIKHASPKLKIMDERVKKIIDYVRQNIDNPISLNNLCQASALSPNHVIRIFKSNMGITPIDYINKKRIEKAQLMLLTENMSIKEIAYHLSFENVSYFNRQFKHFTGTTPKKYRGGN